MPPAADEVRDGDALGGDRTLGEEPEHPRGLPGRTLLDGLPVEDDRALLGREQPGEGPQQGGLAAAVAADDHRDPAIGDVQVERLDDDVLAVGEGHGLRGEFMGHSELP